MGRNWVEPEKRQEGLGLKFIRNNGHRDCMGMYLLTSFQTKIDKNPKEEHLIQLPQTVDI